MGPLTLQQQRLFYKNPRYAQESHLPEQVSSVPRPREDRAADPRARHAQVRGKHSHGHESLPCESLDDRYRNVMSRDALNLLKVLVSL